MNAYIIARLQEPSTWRSFIWVATSFSLVHFNSDQSAAIISLGLALSGAVGIAAPDSLRKKI